MTPRQNLAVAAEQMEALTLHLYTAYSQLCDTNPLAAEAVVQGYAKADQLKSELARLRYLAGDTPGCNAPPSLKEAGNG